jgi:hypothetical protein
MELIGQLSNLPEPLQTLLAQTLAEYQRSEGDVD